MQSHNSNLQMLNTPAILLSTFNGDRFLRAMLDSVASQIGVTPVLYWRDDGSTDSTAEIILSYRASIDLIQVLGSERLGPCSSFLSLLREAAPHHTSFHFADQDDVWELGKVAHARNVVTQRETPTLFHCRQKLIDCGNRPLMLSRLSGPGSFQNALCENIAVGCTVAFNQSAALLVAKENPKHALMHDWWAYLVVSAVGRIEYDNYPWVQYRQHSQNVVGGSQGVFKDWYKRVRRHISRPSNAPTRIGQLSDLLDIHGEILTYEQRSQVERLLAGKTSLSQRLKNCVVPPATRQSWVDQLLLRGILLTNRF
jgi:glycosyltransferase involved in cell wall biosynthesis